jgi:hypothetical protein
MNTISKNKFRAILAKNDIAREIKHYKRGEPISISFIIQQLKDIELYLGEANQPNINSILNSSMDI